MLNGARDTRDCRYHAPMNIEYLDQSRIEALVNPTLAATLAVEVLPSVDSTNAELLRRASRETLDGLALLAEQQTAGRGRSGRRWSSPPSGNLYLSLGWHFGGEVAALAGLSLAVGVAVSEAVADCCAVELSLKWPNDVVHERGKVGGILVETAGSNGSGLTVVIGVGLNLQMSAEGAGMIDQPWVDLSTLAGHPVPRNQLAASVVQSVWALCVGWEQGGFARWRDRWMDRDALRGQRVVLDGAQPRAGIASGVAADGGLLIDTGGQLVPVHSGEARLRKPERQVQ